MNGRQHALKYHFAKLRNIRIFIFDNQGMICEIIDIFDFTHKLKNKYRKLNMKICDMKMLIKWI